MGWMVVLWEEMDTDLDQWRRCMRSPTSGTFGLSGVLCRIRSHEALLTREQWG